MPHSGIFAFFYIAGNRRERRVAVYNENLRTALSEYIYVSDGKEKTIVPHFTYYGYRYVKVSGVSNLSCEDFTAIVLHSDYESIGNVKTGNALVNQLISNVEWGMRGNFLDVPTDCPQRDERMGWTGDTQVFSATASYLADSFAFYRKYLCARLRIPRYG